MSAGPTWLQDVWREVRLAPQEPLARLQLRARLTRPYWRRRFARFGDGSVLDRPKWLYGPAHIAIGARVFILWGGWLSVERPAWSSPEPALVIGDGVVMRPHCTISCAERVVLEDDVAIGAFTTIIDNDHVQRPAEGHNITWSQQWDTTPIRVGRGTWVGDRVAILLGADIGEGCVIGANSVVRGRIPDHSVAVGAPARVVGDVREGASTELRAEGGAER